jgi:hypothetical protein
MFVFSRISKFVLDDRKVRKKIELNIPKQQEILLMNQSLNDTLQI